jgi:hypothetical protein
MNGNAAPVDIATTATAYSTFGGVLAGLAFAGLCIYLSRWQDPDKTEENGNDIKVRHVGAAVFYAMISLAISAFLYANLSGVAESAPNAAVTALLSYGIVFSLSVLSLFYSVALMTLANPSTKDVAKHAYWAVTIAGTIVVLRFLAETARDALIARCGNICGASSILSPWGIGLTLVIAASLSVFITIELLEREPIGKLGKLTNYPTAAPLVVFSAAVLVTTAQSLYLNTRGRSYKPSVELIYLSYAASIFLIILFAMACGRVVVPRAGVNLKALERFDKIDRTKLWRVFKGTFRRGAPTPGQSVRAAPESVKALLVLVVFISGLTMVVLGGSRYYLALIVLAPALTIVVLAAYSRRRSGRHSKASQEAENSALQ